MTLSGLSIVIPVYNEAGNIYPLIKELIHHIEFECPVEVILVDDGSIDASYHEIKACQDIIPSGLFYTCVRHHHRQGQSSALRSGIQQARYDWIITLDGDGQNDPADIPPLLSILSKQTSKTVVFGNRRQRQDSWVRRLSSRFANRIRRSILKDDSFDTGCSLKLFPRQAFLELPFFDHIHRFLPPLFKYTGYTIIHVPVNHRFRSQGKSKYTFWRRLGEGIIDLFGVLWLKKRMALGEKSVEMFSEYGEKKFEKPAPYKRAD